ncbi:MAG: hypothetical protein GX130_02525 [Candidatus Hydrogenedens sp.]|nr:hypothetical protein [Candidatus Hydrogenedens sp.]
MDCQRNLLIQNLMLRWRYSMGAVVYNQSWYQPESSDAMSLLTMYGYPQEARAGLTTLLHKTKGAGFYTNWEAGEKLSHGAEYYFLTRDNTFLEEHLDAHTALCETFAKQIQEDPKGLLEKQRHCGDIPDVDYCTFHQAVGWQGLRHMASAWQLAGFSEVADTYAAVADQLRESLLQAIELSSTGLADGTLFVPSILYGEEKEVYSPITKTRMGSYWNLCMPYAFATGLWPFDSAELTAISDFMHGHGATLLGLLRFNYYPVEIGSYKADGLPGYWSSGVDNVYLPSYQRMLAQRDDAERLILSFYGKLMHGQTRGTFVSGEGDTLGPYPGLEYRSSYGAVCSANNTAFLLPLRLMLVRESTDPATGIPEGLHLAHATPRQWLEAGKEIRVEEAPTAFGLVSFTLKAKSDGSAIEISIKTPERNMPEQLRLKLRLPQGKKIKAVRNNQQSKSIETDAPVSFDAETEIIHLDGLQGNIQLTALLD